MMSVIHLSPRPSPRRSRARALRAEPEPPSQARGCAWDQETCAFAACGGHLEVLKWARENDCPWDEDTREIAAEMGYVEP